MPTDGDSRVLVDTSAWIHFLRPEGERSVALRVQAALLNGNACWCPMVRLELWNGAGASREQKVLRDFERDLPELAINETVWSEAYAIARVCRRAGRHDVPADRLQRPGDKVITWDDRKIHRWTGRTIATRPSWLQPGARHSQCWRPSA